MTPRILLADAEESLRETLCWCLRKEGYRVTTAEDGFEALGVLLNRPIALAVVDLDLPPAGGLDVVARMEGEEALRGIPVVVIGRDEGAARTRSDIAFARKGGDPARLLETVGALTGHRAGATPPPRVRTATPVPGEPPAYQVQLVDQAGRQFRALGGDEQEALRGLIGRLAARGPGADAGGELAVEDTGEFQVFYRFDHHNRRLIVRDIAVRWRRRA